MEGISVFSKLYIQYDCLRRNETTPFVAHFAAMASAEINDGNEEVPSLLSMDMKPNAHVGDTSQESDLFVRIRGLPFAATLDQVMAFFHGKYSSNTNQPCLFLCSFCTILRSPSSSIPYYTKFNYSIKASACCFAFK